jgi:hypothetical protein
MMAEMGSVEPIEVTIDTSAEVAARDEHRGYRERFLGNVVTLLDAG